MVNLYHQTLFIQLLIKFLLATINKETNILVSVRQKSKPDQVTIIIHFKIHREKKGTELSKYIWDLKDKKITNYSIKWSAVKQIAGYNSVTNFCTLFLSEKLVICNFRGKSRLINKLMDLVCKCSHKNRLISSTYKP